MSKEITIERSQVYTLPVTSRGRELPIVQVRAFAEGEVFEPASRSEQVQGGLVYSGGILIGQIPKDQPAVRGPYVDQYRSYNYQRPVFEGSTDTMHRWVPVKGGQR